MKIGIFSDIHGNIYAFEKIWDKLKKESCDKYIFLGDICGYYYYQNEIIEILREIKNLTAIMGNNDDIFLKILKDGDIEKEYTEKYGKSYSILKENITPDNLIFLKKLPRKYIMTKYKIAAFHGSPWNYLNEYIYPTSLLDRFRDLPYRFILLGHTHYPMYKRMGNIYIINPGSCGQPRDYNQPIYATLDVPSGKIKFIRVEYNKKPLINDIIRHSEKNKYLINILKRTKSKDV